MIARSIFRIKRLSKNDCFVYNIFQIFVALLFTLFYDSFAMNIILKGVLEEELERGKRKLRAYSETLSKCQKGSLVVNEIHGDKYIYRKQRIKNRIVSEYIGPLESDAAKKAYEDRKEYLHFRDAVRIMKREVKSLAKLVKSYK